MTGALFSNFDSPSLFGERERLISRIATGVGAALYTSNWQLAEEARCTRTRAALFFFILVRERMRGTKILVCTGSHDRGVTLWARLLGMRVWWVVWHSSDLVQCGPIRRVVRRVTGRRVRCIVPFAETAALLSGAGFHFISTTIIPPAFDPALLHQQTSIFDELADRTYRHGLSLCFVVGIISPLIKESGIEHAITAARELRELIPHFQLIIVGDGPEKQQLQWLVKMLGLHQCVRFVGQRDAPQRWYQFFDAYIICTASHRIIGTSALEALALGIAVVTGPHEGFEDLFDTHDQWILPHYNSGALINAIVELERNQPKTSALEQAVSHRILSEFSLDSIIVRWKQDIFQ